MDSALSNDLKIDTQARIKADHDRRGIPYFAFGEERDRRAREAHNGVQPDNIQLGVSDASG